MYCTPLSTLRTAAHCIVTKAGTQQSLHSIESDPRTRGSGCLTTSSSSKDLGLSTQIAIVMDLGAISSITRYLDPLELFLISNSGQVDCRNRHLWKFPYTFLGPDQTMFVLMHLRLHSWCLPVVRTELENCCSQAVNLQQVSSEVGRDDMQASYVPHLQRGGVGRRCWA